MLRPKEMIMVIEKKLAELGLQLPVPPVPAAHYIPYVQVGNLLFVGGNTGRLNGEPHTYVGKVGDKVTLEQAYQMARHCALNHLAIIKAAVGDLDRVERFVKLLGFVNVAPGFTKMPQVVNGASDVFIEIWGERGQHARAAVGVASLANDAPVETEVIVQIKL
jgi:enamine deaminase RidA (YjgF/YER057c/UK114 family)